MSTDGRDPFGPLPPGPSEIIDKVDPDPQNERDADDQTKLNGGRGPSK